MIRPIRRILLLAAAAGPLQAIEPPVEVQPIPPRTEPGKAVEPVPRAIPAVPEEEVPRALPMPEEEQAVRPYIGVILDPVPDIVSSHLKLADGEGLVVGEVVAGGPAEAAGLAVDDIITRVDGVVVGTPEEVRSKVEAHAVGDRVRLEVIQRGVRREMEVTLGAVPGRLPAVPQDGALLDGQDALNGFLENLPEKHAELMRQAMQQRLRAFEGLGDNAGMPENWQRDVMRRLEQMRLNGEGLDLDDFKAESSVRLLDDQGSIEMKSVDGLKEVRVFDKAGVLLWEGPYDTDQDKAAVPDDIRERIDGVNFDFDLGGNGLQFKLGPNRFRPLEQIDPVPAEPVPGD